jgi:hypothetical protein
VGVTEGGLEGATVGAVEGDTEGLVVGRSLGRVVGACQHSDVRRSQRPDQSVPAVQWPKAGRLSQTGTGCVCTHATSIEHLDAALYLRRCP